MKTDVIVYEKKNALTRIALLGAGEALEFEFIKENRRFAEFYHLFHLAPPFSAFSAAAQISTTDGMLPP